MVRKILILLIFLAVSACTRHYDWGKDDAGSGEVELARTECRDESGSYNFLDGRNQSVMVTTTRGDRYAILNATTAAREADLYNDCMRAKGFSLSPAEEP
jgi:hypothetical protein